MKKSIITLALTLIAIVNTNAQQVINKLDLTGFTVKIEKAREFSYTSNAIINSVVEGDKMILVSNDSSRSELTIFMPNVETITLNNCHMTVDYRLNIQELDLNMNDASVATLQADMKNLTANLSSASKLTVVGRVKEMECKLDQAILESAFIRIGSLKLSAINQSIANMKIDATRVDAHVELASGVTFRGYADVLKCYNGVASKIQASQLEVKRAQVDNAIEGMVTINARQVMTGSSAKNIYASK